MTDHQDVIAAFVDNEPVGADELAAALANEEGRAYLIDLLVLRGLVGGAVHGTLGRRSDGVPGQRPDGAPGQRSDGAPGLQPRGRSLWLTAAAALLAVGVTAGFFAGRGTFAGGGSVNSTPTPVVTPAGASPSAAPAPTHVIRLEKGIDWNERSGGN